MTGDLRENLIHAIRERFILIARAKECLQEACVVGGCSGGGRVHDPALLSVLRILDGTQNGFGCPLISWHFS